MKKLNIEKLKQQYSDTYPWLKELETVIDADFTYLALAAAPLEETFCTFVEKPKYLEDLSYHASMIITNREVAHHIKNSDNSDAIGICISSNPRLDFFRLHNMLAEQQIYPGSDTQNTIGENCSISNMACIAPQNVTIGNNVTIEEFVSIKEGVTIKDNAVIRAGTVVGGEGFEFKYSQGFETMPVTHCGGVIIEENVEIQQNTTIDKGLYPWDNTVIGSHTRIDNLVYIAHGVKIGSGTMIVATSGIGGRCVIGEKCWIGLGSSIRNGITIGDNARVNMGAVVTKSLPAGSSVSGNFAVEHSKFIENIKKFTE